MSGRATRQARGEQRQPNIGYQPATIGATAASNQFSPFCSPRNQPRNWSLTSEYAIRNVETGVPGINFIGESYYAQGPIGSAPKWRASCDTMPCMRTAMIVMEKGRNRVWRPAYDDFAKDLAAGVRWDVTPWFMLRGEYHYMKELVGFLLSRIRRDVEVWSLFAISASLRF